MRSPVTVLIFHMLLVSCFKNIENTEAMVHLDTLLFIISVIVFTVSGSINFAHSDSCSHERYDDDSYDDRDRGGTRFEIGNGECEVDDSDSRGDHSGYHGGHRPRPHPHPHPHPHRPPKV